MKLVDVAGRNHKEAETIFKKAVKELKSKTPHVAFTDFAINGNNVFVLAETDSPEAFIDIVETLIEKSSNAKKVSSKVHKGHFDWAADTYIKDAGEVRFKF